MGVGAVSHTAVAVREVHVWWTRDVLAFEDAAVHLTEAEQHRGDRFRRSIDRRRFLARRGILRTLLGGYLEAPPAMLRIDSTAYGRPYLADPHGELVFSLARSGNAAIYALSRRAVGVDIELMRTSIDVPALAEHVCTPGEQAALAQLPVPHRTQGFFTFWTHKEAVCKADGRGLSLSPATVDVTSALTQGQSVAAIASPTATDVVWYSSSMSLMPGLAAAVAVDDIQSQLVIRRLR